MLLRIIISLNPVNVAEISYIPKFENGFLNKRKKEVQLRDLNLNICGSFVMHCCRFCIKDAVISRYSNSPRTATELGTGEKEGAS